MSASMSLSSAWEAPTIAGGGSAGPDRGTRSRADASPGAERPLVARADRHLRRPHALRRLFVPRRHRERELLLRAVSLAALLAVHCRELRAPGPADHRPVVEPLPGDPHRGVPDRVPRHLLLLPPQLLPRVLLVAPGVRRPRRARPLRRRDALPLRHPELPPLLPVPRHGHPRVPVVGHDPRVRLRRTVRHRSRVAHHARERLAPHRLHALLPLGALSLRRLSRQLPRQVVALPALVARQPVERAARALGLGEPHRRRLHRPLHPPSRDGPTPRGSEVRTRRRLRDVVVAAATHDFDVVVIGAGGAGLRAAIEATAQGAKTAIVCKSLLGKAHTVMAEGGIAAALANVWKEDSWQVPFRDTMRGGKLLNNWRLAQLHAPETPDRVLELEEWGALFDRTKDGLILQRDFGGHRYARLAHVGDRTGLEMIRTLQDHVVAQGIDVFMECTVRHLLTDGGRVAGAIAYWRQSGALLLFQAKAVVLATGGVGKAWKVTSNSWEYTGDGMAMALEAGADLIDMEMTQVYPAGS